MNRRLKSPFKFLDAYEAGDREAFFGREAELDELYRMVFRTNLMLVYGLSGTGKTSLVQCGLAKRFDTTDWLPFYVRRGDDLLRSLHEQLNVVLPERVNTDAPVTDKLSGLYRYYLRPVYLIFDQFEELFILGEAKETQRQVEAFGNFLQTIIASELPCKIMLIMREEFIAQLYPLERMVPTIYDHRLRVEQMSKPQFKQVIEGSAERFNIEITSDGVEGIYNNVSNKKFGIQLPYLQVYLDALYRDTFSNQYAGLSELPEELPELKWSETMIKEFGVIGDTLARFLDQREEELRDDLDKRFSVGASRYVTQVLDGLVTPEGTKRPVSFTRAGEDKSLMVASSVRERFFAGVPDRVLSFVLQELMTARLLKERDDKLELAHDSLAELLNGRRTEEQRDLNAKRIGLRQAYADHLQVNRMLNADEVKLYELYLDRLDVDKNIRKFVADSAETIRRREKSDRRNARLLRIWFVATASAIVVAAVLGIFLLLFQQEDSKKKKIDDGLLELREMKRFELDASVFAESSYSDLEREMQTGYDSLRTQLINRIQEDSLLYLDEDRPETKALREFWSTEGRGR